ncbi:MAG: DUF2341 domain-containing protein, partial [Candidatus Hodarchaeota archaeon]
MWYKKKISSMFLLIFISLNTVTISIEHLLEHQSTEESDNKFKSPFDAFSPSNSNEETRKEFTQNNLNELKESSETIDRSQRSGSRAPTGGWADSSFLYRKNITILASQVTADLSNFPVLIELYDSDLQQYSRADGWDIMFTNASGYQLDHEIEFYDRTYNATHAHLVAWVKTDLLDLQDTIISMYFGKSITVKQENPEGVWDGNYMLVQHLHETSGTHYDSTNNDNNGNTNGSLNQDVTGKIDGADDFDGTNDNVAIGNSPSLNISNAITIEAWIKDDVGEKRRIVTKGGEIFVLRTNWNGQLHGYLKKGGSLYHAQSLNNLITTGTYHHVILTWDGVSGDHNLRLFHNGTEISSYTTQNSITSPLDSSVGSLFIGSHETGEWWDGEIDEVRISNIARSADWIQTEFNNQNNPVNFYSIGTKEESPEIGDWAIPSFKYRKTLTIDANQVSGSNDLTNYPLLISLNDSDLHDTSKVQADGDDILFTDANGQKLDHEFELFDQTGNGTHANLIAWVRVPSLSATIDTNITMYYGNNLADNQVNPEGVWSEYSGVWHLDESSGGSGAIKDSTKTYNGTDSGGVSFNEQGKINSAILFHGDNDYISVGDLDLSNSWSISCWATINEFPQVSQYSSILSKFESYTIEMHNDRIQANTWEAGWANDSPLDYYNSTTGVWFHIYYVRNGSDSYFYFNGDLKDSDDTTTTNTAQNNNNLLLGAFNENFEYLNGTIDEVKITTVAKSQNWIITEFNNQDDPESFIYLISEEESFSSWWADGSFSKRMDITIDKDKIGYDWTYPSLQYRKTIIIDQNKVSGTQNLTNFPLLVDIFDEDLRDTNKVQTDGDDIAFT